MSSQVYTATATATGYASTNTMPPSTVTATTTASASSYISQSDACNSAYQLALLEANTIALAQSNANIIGQSVYISESGGSGGIGTATPYINGYQVIYSAIYTNNYYYIFSIHLYLYLYFINIYE